MHFAERFFKILHHVILASADTGPGRASMGEVAKAVDGLIDEEAALSLPPGLSSQAHLEALRPVMLWIDERLLTSKRPDAAQWHDHSLQRRHFETNVGGDVFFERLEETLHRRHQALAPVPPPYDPQMIARLSKLWIAPGQGQEPLESVLDAYALCLILGYQGRLADYPAGEAEGLRELARLQIRGWADDAAPLSPDRVRSNRLRRLLGDYGWLLPHVLLPLAVMAILYLKRTAVIDGLPF
jgi:hypothetical protein